MAYIIIRAKIGKVFQSQNFGIEYWKFLGLVSDSLILC